MARFGMFVGLGLILAAIALLILALLAPADTPLGAVFTAVICRENEELTRYVGPEQGIHHRHSITFYCEQSPDERREVTGWMVLAIAGVFFVPFLGGLLLDEVAARRAPRRGLGQTQWQVKSVVVDSGTPVVVQAKNLPPEVAEKVAQLLTPLMAKTARINGGESIAAELAQALGQFNPPGTDQPNAEVPVNLAERLQQLESALSQGLITQAEYDETRKAILRDFKE